MVVTIYIGCDLGGSNIKAGIVNLQQGSVLHADSVPTKSQDGYDAVMGRMVDLLRSPISGSGLDQSKFPGIGCQRTRYYRSEKWNYFISS